MDFAKVITLIDDLKTEMRNLQERLRKSEEEKEDLKLRLNCSKRQVIDIQFQLKAQTVVTTNTEKLDLPLAVSGNNDERKITGNQQSISQAFGEIRAFISEALSDDDSASFEHIPAGFSKRSSVPPDADSDLSDHLDNFPQISLPPDADSDLSVHLDCSPQISVGQLPDADSDLLDHLDCSPQISVLPDVDDGLLDHYDVLPETKDREMQLMPDSSQLTPKQKRNKRTTRRHKEKRIREAIKKAEISIEESLLSSVPNAVVEPVDGTVNPNTVLVEDSSDNPDESSTEAIDESGKRTECSNEYLSLCDDADQLSDHDDINSEIQDFCSVLPSAAESSLQIVQAPSVNPEHIAMNSEFINENTTSSINLESDTELADGSLPPKIDNYFQEPANEEFLHLSNLPYLVPGETIASFFHQHIGPVQFFTRLLDENGLYKGKAIIHFLNPGDATKAMLMTRPGLVIHKRKIKVKLFINGVRRYPNEICEEPSSRDCNPFFSGQYYWM